MQPWFTVYILLWYWTSMLWLIGPLHDPVTWYGINYTGTQIMQWDFQNKGKSGWTGVSSFVLEVPRRNLHPSAIYSVPCDRIVQRAYWHLSKQGICWPVSHDHIVDSSLEPIEGTWFFLSWPLTKCWFSILYAENLTAKLQNSNQSSTLSWVSLIGLWTTQSRSYSVRFKAGLNLYINDVT